MVQTKNLRLATSLKTYPIEAIALLLFLKEMHFNRCVTWVHKNLEERLFSLIMAIDRLLKFFIVQKSLGERLTQKILRK